MGELEQRAKEIFGEAWELAGAERDAFLERACGGDADLVARVRALLVACDEADAGGLLATGVHDGMRDAFLDYAERVPDDENADRTVLAAIEALQGSAPRVSLAGQEAGASDASSSAGPKGNYRILGEIARGGMGVVLRGRDTDLGREVAVKVLHEDLHRRPAVVQRFVEEAQIGGQLQHPGIVPVYELGLMADDRPYFTMKLVRGRTLKELLEERESAGTTLQRLVSIFEHVCQTVAYAHSRNVIHRDLKPGNVMVGRFGEVQVVDWGLAKVIGAGTAPGERPPAPSESAMVETVRSREGSQESSHSLAGSVMGTPAYMSPEQARGQVDQLDERTDVFALGAILCEILTGAPPYGGGTRSTILSAARAELEPAIERLRACEADEELVRLALTCLSAAAADRPRSAAVVADALAAHSAAVDQRLHKARVSAAAERMRAKAARKVQRTATVAAAAVAVALVVSLFLWQRARDAAEEEQRARFAESDAKRALEDTNARLARSNAELADALALAGEEADKAKAVSDFLAGVLTSSSPLAGGRFDLTVREAVDRAAGRLDEGSFAGQPDLEARVRHAISEAYSALGDDERALAQIERARTLALGAAGQETGATLMMLAQLGGARRENGALDEAEATLRTVLERIPAVPDVEARLEPLTWSALAAIARDRGEHLEARALSERAVELARAVGSEELVADVLNDLALAQEALGETLAAVATQEEALELTRKTRGARHFSTAVAMSNLAGLYADAARFDQAEALYLEALAILRRAGGDRHPSVASVLDSIGRLYTRTGRTEEAHEALREALSIRREAHGPDDIAVAYSLNNLAALEVDLGRFDDAALHLARALPIFVAERGADHPSIATLRANLTGVQRLLAQPDATLARLQRNASESEARLGADHPATASAKHNLAIELSRAGRLDAAEELFYEVLEVRAERFGERSAECAATIDGLAALSRRRGRIAESESLARQALDVRREALGPRHRDVALSLNTLGEVLAERDDPRAEDAFREAVAIAAETLPLDHWMLASIRANHALVLQRQGAFPEAEAALLASHTTLESTLGSAHPRTRATTRQLAELYEAWDSSEPDAGHADQAARWRAVRDGQR